MASRKNSKNKARLNTSGTPPGNEKPRELEHKNPFVEFGRKTLPRLSEEDVRKILDYYNFDFLLKTFSEELRNSSKKFTMSIKQEETDANTQIKIHLPNDLNPAKASKYLDSLGFPKLFKEKYLEQHISAHKYIDIFKGKKLDAKLLFTTFSILLCSKGDRLRNILICDEKSRERWGNIHNWENRRLSNSQIVRIAGLALANIGMNMVTSSMWDRFRQFRIFLKDNPSSKILYYD